ncbi:MAG: co-chaperone GroES [Nitrospirae bacterium]|nr:co-chaperone GroES [Nitrospirota bacterium]
MKIRPLNDWVLIKLVDAEERTAGGLYIPEVAKQKPQWGLVEAAGPGRTETKKGKDKKEEKKFVPTEVRAGQKVLFEKYMSSEFEVDGQKVLMVREQNVLGIIEDETAGSNTALQKKASSDLQKKAPSELEKKGPGALEAVEKPAPKKRSKK